MKFLPKVSDPQGQWMICVGSWGACFRRAFVIIWSWGTNRKHFFSGLNLTAHDTQLITGLFEKQPQNAGGVKSTFGQENTKSSLYLLILEHTHTHTHRTIYLSQTCLSISQTLTHLKPPVFEVNSGGYERTVTHTAFPQGWRWEGEAAMKDAVDAAGGGRGCGALIECW